jgi:hypothetical protein
MWLIVSEQNPGNFQCYVKHEARHVPERVSVLAERLQNNRLSNLWMDVGRPNVRASNKRRFKRMINAPGVQDNRWRGFYCKPSVTAFGSLENIGQLAADD